MVKTYKTIYPLCGNSKDIGLQEDGIKLVLFIRVPRLIDF